MSQFLCHVTSNLERSQFSLCFCNCNYIRQVAAAFGGDRQSHMGLIFIIIIIIKPFRPMLSSCVLHSCESGLQFSLSSQHQNSRLRADIKGYNAPSLRSLLVIVEERMSSSGCLQHLLVTGRASGLKISEPITPHRPVIGWLGGSVVERWSLTGELSLVCTGPAADG